MVNNILNPMEKNILPYKAVLVDTNFLLSWWPVPGPSNNNNKQPDAGDVLFELIQRKIPIEVDAHVVSEYLNRYLRAYYQEYMDRFNPTKDWSGDHYKHYFRNSNEYPDIARRAISNLKSESSLNIEFVAISTSGLNASIELMQTHPLEFTDAVLVENAIEHSAAILTNDKDIKNVSIEESLTIYSTN
ncbi:type II toxin-antitoxin system VapC family toxin [Weissella minor]|uniref:type II toxin-antitoxin system VapC family toxin n=1 Tax=Weissella minor TaxID=1620 RepID=UPI001BAE659E|nr:type II toxin-antitoxin system VapC family toxin [Weissella minor]MBS0950379.1 type II toxin-antitoxin system VapC family toxin [Weissella minor]